MKIAFCFIRIFLVLIACLLSNSISAAANKPAFIVTPFTTNVTIGNNTGTDVIIAVQNNTGVRQTITNLVPLIPKDSSVTATLVDNFCDTLAPGESCEASYTLFGLNQQNDNHLNISICSFNGAICSQIKEPIQVKTLPLTNVFVFPTNPSVAIGVNIQFKAIGLFSNKLIQDITEDVTWSSSDQTKATVSNASGSKGLATAIVTGTSTIIASINGLNGTSRLTITPATLTSITITPVNPSVAKGDKQLFSAVGIYSDNTHQDLTTQATWSSDNDLIATVSNTNPTKGQATAKNIGQTNIKATYDGVIGSTEINVTAATLTSISVTPTNPLAPKGTTLPFTATGIYSDNSTADLTDFVTWNTGSALVAIISNHSGLKGKALAVNIGTTSVSATLGSIVGFTNIQVTPAALSSIDVSPKNKTLIEGETQQYLATGIYTDNSTQDLTSSATWESSNNAVATVSNTSSSKGLATAVAAGSVTVSATQQGIIGETGLTVNPITLLSITVTPSNPTIANGTTLQFSATGNYSNGTTRDLTTFATWISSQPAVAIISNASGSNGLATSLSTGSTLISAVFQSVVGNTTLTISAAALTSISVTPANATVPKATTEQYTATGTYTDASTKNITNEVTWSSSNETIATISNALATKGLATGVKNGSTTIQATSGIISGNTPLSVITLKIGDSYDGGVVACLNGGLDDFIVATTDNSSNLQWGGRGTLTNAQSTVNGSTNTQTIVNTLGAGTTYAAGLCDAYEIDSLGNSPCVVGNICYSDWFLPSTNQLSCMRKNKNKIGGFSGVPYWSSTEDANSPTLNAFSYNFKNSNSDASVSDKNLTYHVRCARFIISP